MKPYNQLILLIAMLLTAVLASCKKDGYLSDGGLSVAATPFSTYDYLKNNKYHQFDTLLILIDHYQLKDAVNQSKTFFAPTDISIRRLISSIAIRTEAGGAVITTQATTLQQLTDSVSAKVFEQYMFDQTITLDAATVNPVTYINKAGAVAPSAVKKVVGTSTVYLSSSALTYSYYTLQYVVVNGVPDGSPGAPAGDPVDAVLPCQTTGIETSSGTTLHVLSNVALLKKLK